MAIFDKRFVDKNGLAHLVGFLAFQWDEPTNLSNAEKISMIKEVERIKEFVIKRASLLAILDVTTFIYSLLNSKLTFF